MPEYKVDVTGPNGKTTTLTVSTGKINASVAATGVAAVIQQPAATNLVGKKNNKATSSPVTSTSVSSANLTGQKNNKDVSSSAIVSTPPAPVVAKVNLTGKNATRSNVEQQLQGTSEFIPTEEESNVNQSGTKAIQATTQILKNRPTVSRRQRRPPTGAPTEAPTGTSLGGRRIRHRTQKQSKKSRQRK